MLRLLWNRDNVFALTGDGSGGDLDARWEGMRRVSRWTHKVYEFAWGGGVFVWVRTKLPCEFSFLAFWLFALTLFSFNFNL